jgi:hypothetical protein
MVLQMPQRRSCPLCCGLMTRTLHEARSPITKHVRCMLRLRVGVLTLSCV